MIIGSEPVSVDAISDVQPGVRALWVAAHGHQTLLRHRRGDAVRLDHRADAEPPPRTSTVNSSPRVGRCASRPTAHAVARCRAARSPAACGRDRRPGHRRRTAPTATSVRSGCRATTLAGATGAGPPKPGAPSAPGCGPGSRAATPRAPPTSAPGCGPGDLGVYLDGELYVTGRTRRSGCHRRPQPLSAGHRGHRGGGLTDGAARLRYGVRRAGGDGGPSAW